MITETKYLNREAWLAAKNATPRCVGASIIPDILGVGYNTPLHTWGVMTGRVPEFEGNEMTAMGLACESGIARRYEEVTGRTVTDPGQWTVFWNDEFPLLAVTPDRLLDPREEPLELKNVTYRGKRDWENGTPLRVQVQLQAQMAVLGVGFGSVAANIANETLAWEDFQDHSAHVDYMLAEVERFLWYVEHDRQPPVTDRDRYTLQELYPEHVPGEVVELPDSVMPYVTRWLEDREAKSELDAKARKLEARMNGDAAQITGAIAALNGEAELARLPDGRTLTWRTTHRKPQAATQFRTLRLAKDA